MGLVNCIENFPCLALHPTCHRSLTKAGPLGWRGEGQCPANSRTGQVTDPSSAGPISHPGSRRPLCRGRDTHIHTHPSPCFAWAKPTPEQVNPGARRVGLLFASLPGGWGGASAGGLGVRGCLADSGLGAPAASCLLPCASSNLPECLASVCQCMGHLAKPQVQTRDPTSK